MPNLDRYLPVVHQHKCEEYVLFYQSGAFIICRVLIGQPASLPFNALPAFRTWPTADWSSDYQAGVPVDMCFFLRCHTSFLKQCVGLSLLCSTKIDMWKGDLSETKDKPSLATPLKNRQTFN